jgi:hypothetical protein
VPDVWSEQEVLVEADGLVDGLGRSICEASPEDGGADTSGTMFSGRVRFVC